MAFPMSKEELLAVLGGPQPGQIAMESLIETVFSSLPSSEIGYTYTEGDNVTILAPDSITQAGGDFIVEAGTSTADNGGNVSIAGGSSTAEDFYGGNVSISGGVGGLNGKGGNILLSGGSGTGTGTGGNVTIYPGADGNFIIQIPTSDPGIEGALYSNGVPSAGVPKALMISGG